MTHRYLSQNLQYFYARSSLYLFDKYKINVNPRPSKQKRKKQQSIEVDYVTKIELRTTDAVSNTSVIGH